MRNTKVAQSDPRAAGITCEQVSLGDYPEVFEAANRGASTAAGVIIKAVVGGGWKRSANKNQTIRDAKDFCRGNLVNGLDLGRGECFAWDAQEKRLHRIAWAATSTEPTPKEAESDSTELGWGSSARDSGFSWRKQGDGPGEEVVLGQGADPHKAAVELLAATARHNDLERTYAASLHADGYEVRYAPLPGEPDFDILATMGNSFVLVEVKTIKPENQSHQLRLGIGQLFEYRYRLASVYRGRIIDLRLLVDRTPETRPPLAPDHWFQVCKAHDIELVVLSDF